MDDLNDLFLFAKVAEAGSFSAAGRRLGLPKSTLSRRIAALELTLDVRLIQRTSRKFSLTEAGERFLRHCQVIVSEAEAARLMLQGLQHEPAGTLRLSCPIVLLQQVFSPLITRYLRLYPQVDIQVEATNRAVDVIGEGFDLAIRVRRLPLEDSGLVVRRLAKAHGVALGSPDLLERYPLIRTPEDLAGIPAVSMTNPGNRIFWSLTHQETGETRQVAPHARLVTDEMLALLNAVEGGIGISMLPLLLARDPLASGRLVRILPDWQSPDAILHAVFPSRRGLLPSVRRFIDFLTLELADADFV